MQNNNRILRKLGHVVLLLSLLSILGVGLADAQPFFDFYGYSFLSGAPATVGTVVHVPLLFNSIQPDPIWPLDFSNSEYTVWVDGLEIVDVQAFGPNQIITYAGGTIAIHADPSKNSIWLVNPPNGSVPSSFEDGVTELAGHFIDMVMMYNTTSGVGTVSGTITWDSGARLGSLPIPSGWTFFGGVSNHGDLSIPSGYDLAWDPQIYGPEVGTPVMVGSWGRVKGMFRRAR